MAGWRSALFRRAAFDRYSQRVPSVLATAVHLGTKRELSKRPAAGRLAKAAGARIGLPTQQHSRNQKKMPVGLNSATGGSRADQGVRPTKSL